MPALTCPNCGGHDFWDNRGDAIPNYRCKNCKKALTIGEPPTPEQIAAAKAARSPATVASSGPSGPPDDGWYPDESQRLFP